MRKLMMALTMVVAVWASPTVAQQTEHHPLTIKMSNIGIKLITGEPITVDELRFYEKAWMWLGIRDGLRAAYGLQYGDACDPPLPPVLHATAIDGTFGAFRARYFQDNPATDHDERNYIGSAVTALEWLREQRPGCYPGPRWR